MGAYRDVLASCFPDGSPEPDQKAFLNDYIAHVAQAPTGDTPHSAHSASGWDEMAAKNAAYKSKSLIEALEISQSRDPRL